MFSPFCTQVPRKHFQDMQQMSVLFTFYPFWFFDTMKTSWAYFLKFDEDRLDTHKLLSLCDVVRRLTAHPSGHQVLL